MAVQILNNILSVFALLQTILILTKAEDIAIRGTNSASLNVSTSLEDYITQNDRQYYAQITSDKAQITDFRTNFQSQLDFINYNKDLLEAELVETDKKLYPLEFLDELSKHCVQKYSSILITVSTLSSSFASCISTGTANLNSIISAPENTQRVLNNYYTSNWKNGILDCERKNKASYKNHTICVTKLIETTNNYFINNQRSFVTQMEASRCSADSRIRQTIQCVFSTMNKVSASIGEVTRLVDDCIAGVGLCEPCGDGSNNDQYECPNVIDLYTSSQTYNNKTIENPFYGLNSKADCVLVNLVRPA